MGHQNALLGVLGSSAVILTVVIYFYDVELVTDYSAWWLIVLGGIGIMGSTLLLYWGLARGPVTVVAPIVGGYPAFSLLFAFLVGVRPSAIQWFAMGLVLLGVTVVAACAELELPADEEKGDHGEITRTIIIALASSLSFALTFMALQEAMPVYGEMQTIWMARWVSVLAIACLFLIKHEKPAIPLRWWPMVGVQGVLDGMAFVALLLGSQGLGAQITLVIASCFSAITVILARIFLKELMTWYQWGGIILIISGVVMLSMH
jgi:drug/metabolite transporter (DMT)-like permease